MVYFTKCKVSFTFSKNINTFVMNQNPSVMKVNYLFPNKYKNVGWLILIPSAILGLLVTGSGYEPNYLDFRVPALFIDEIIGERHLVGMVENNLLNEILGILVIISSLFVAFSREKVEDEYISKIRLESLVWAVFVNYGILLVAFLCIYDLSFLWVMIFNMFTILWFFIIRFNWRIVKLKNASDEK